MDAKFSAQPTADGSLTYYSETFQEAFHSHSGARQEAYQKFVVPCQLSPLARSQPQIQLLDVCYGLGYNTAAALETIWSTNPHCRIQWWGLDISATIPRQAITEGLLGSWPIPIVSILTQLATQFTLKTPQFEGQLLIGDARQTLLAVIDQDCQADAIFLDPFSPPKCPQLWTVEFCQLLAACLKPSGRLATYSCAASVRSALQLAHFYIGSTPGVGRRSPGTIASLTPAPLPPLSLQELEHLQTRAALPYRDPNLRNASEAITQQRQHVQQISPLEPTSRWKKRWQLPRP